MYIHADTRPSLGIHLTNNLTIYMVYILFSYCTINNIILT